MNQQHHPAMRVNLLIALAFALVILCLAVTIWRQVEDEFAKGVLTLVLGRVLGYVDNIYAYEFQTTRSSARKDETIQDLTKTAAAVATTQATQVAADTAMQQQGPAGGSMKVDEVSIAAGTVNVDGKQVAPPPAPPP